MLIEIPEKMKNLKLDKRSYPIPYIILIDDEGTPHFKINDDIKVETAIRWKFCAICGTRMKNGDMWVIGGPGSAFHIHGAYIDTPVHHECGTYALQVCPYLAVKNYNTYAPAEKAVNRVVSENNQIFINPTVNPTKPDIFVFAQITDFTVTRSVANMMPVRYIKPVRPFLDIEIWKDGKELNKDDENAIESFFNSYVIEDNFSIYFSELAALRINPDKVKKANV